MTEAEFPSTEEDSNWTVVVFRCPRRNWTEILRTFLSELDKQGLSLIPNYRIGAFEQSSDSLIFSVRILRRQEHEDSIKDLIVSFMKDYDYDIDPKGEAPFSQHHQWRDTKGWTKERCQTLSKISRFVLEIMKSDTSKEQKEEWTHLFSNMAGVFDLFKIYQSPETILSPERTPYRVLDYSLK